MANRKARRERPAINAGSMADIAFLLLIFFLVTTTILSDKGILVKLPPWAPDQPTAEVRKRNLLPVAINSLDQLFVRGEDMAVNQLRDEVKEFVLNPSANPHLAVKPSQAVVSLINDRSTSYATYLSVYNELKAAYNEMWNEQAWRDYERPYDELNLAQQRAVRDVIPLVISEAEPVDYANATEG